MNRREGPTKMFAKMEALEERRLMAVLDDGLDLGGLGGLFGGNDPLPPFPSSEPAIYLGRFSTPRVRNVIDSVNTTDDNVDVFRIKVDRRLKFTFDLKNL